jgi:hypothetical protein
MVLIRFSPWHFSQWFMVPPTHTHLNDDIIPAAVANYFPHFHPAITALGCTGCSCRWFEFQLALRTHAQAAINAFKPS